MIPVKLAIRNFMPFRDNVPPLHFGGIHTAVICGDNGNGKSALIDALTWALWGKTRAKSDDSLIHLGQTEMEVELDFAVGQQVYRVIRKHAKPRRRQASGRTILELQLATANGFKSITGTSIQQTQQEIIKILHMDYPTFINSALLLQGRADEFTVSSPASRKQILANILGLSFYDSLEEEARELARQKEGETTQLETAIQELDEELAQKPAYEAELKEAELRLKNLEMVIKEGQSRLNELRQKKDLLENKREQSTQLEELSLKTKQSRQRWEEQVNECLQKIEEYEELIAQRPAIEAGYRQLLEAKGLNEQLGQKLRKVIALRDSKHQLEMVIWQSSQHLLNEHFLLENRIRELETNYDRLPQLKDGLQQLQLKLHQLASEETVVKKKRQLSQELGSYIHRLGTSKTQLEREIEETKDKLALLLSEEGAKCPLCETELGPEGLKLIETKYTTEKDDKSDRLKLTEKELAAKKTELDSLEKEISQEEARLGQEKALAQGKANLTSQEISEVEKVPDKLREEKGRRGEIEEHLASKDFATSEQIALYQLEEELARLGYKEQQHDEVRHRLAELEQYERPKQKLEEASRQITQERETLSRSRQASQELGQNLEINNQRRQELATELSLLPQVTIELTQAEMEHQRLTEQQRKAQETVGSAKEKRQHLRELETKKKERENLRAKTAQEEDIYKELARAFGKGGIPALLIETALPEIEIEANRLLGRMTDNRMHIKFETQRETKKGDVLETLDINIADELGTRNYEMFSGGEAFRINFAIRIALSRLLVRRAGAPLPTLIIDEGFGTQDSSGLEKLKEAIISIQDDFEKIIVITHIEELRDAFPIRIDVVKTHQGSTLMVA